MQATQVLQTYVDLRLLAQILIFIFIKGVMFGIGIADKYNGLNYVKEITKYWSSFQDCVVNYLYCNRKDGTEVSDFLGSCMSKGEIFLLNLQIIYLRELGHYSQILYFQ